MSIPPVSFQWARGLVFGLRWNSGNRTSKRPRAMVWLFTVGFCHHSFFSVSVESLAMNFCSQTGASGPGARGRLCSPRPTRQRAKCAVTRVAEGGDRRAGGRQACPCPTLRGSGLSVWRPPGGDEAGLGELTFSSGLTGTWAPQQHPWSSPGASHSLRFLARPSACRVRVQRCTHSEKLRLLWSAL